MSTVAPARDERLLRRLEELSVSDGHDAFEDVPWDEHRLDDARFGPWPFDPVVHTAWWQAQGDDVRQAYLRDRVASMFRVGWEFENILQRGLLDIAYRMPNGHPAFRYVHHEVIEESQHTLMFNELVGQLNTAAKGMPAGLKWLGTWLGPLTARRARPMFYLLVLGGELPIDHMQRAVLREPGVLPPLVAEVCRIHVDEESRHVSFARQEIEVDGPRLGPVARHVTALFAPIVFGIMTRLMVHPTPWIVRTHGIPRDQLAEACDVPEVAEVRRSSVRRAKKLCERTGLMTAVSRRLWRAVGL